MRYFIGSTSVPSFAAVTARIPDAAMLMCPGTWRTPHSDYACDNGVKAAYDKSVDMDRGEAERTYYRSFWWSVEGDEQWRKMLFNLPVDNPPLWVLLPDVVADWPRTLELARLYLPLLRQVGVPVALALQDGCDFDEVLEIGPEWAFVGGSTDWKLANVHAICEFFHVHNIRVHVGRVNTMQRMRLCQSAGADSVDGTTLNKFRDATLPRISRAINQPCLQI